MTVIDGYAHCGISKYEPIESVLEAHREAGISGGALIQHYGEYDNRYLLDAARTAAGYRAVASIDRQSSQWPSTLDSLLRDEYVVGIRLVVDGPGPWEQLARACIDAQAAVMLFATIGRADYYSVVDRILADLQGRGTLILSHCGATVHDAPDAYALERFRSHPNIYVLVSGLATWPAARDQVKQLVRGWNETRCLWGSNFPVCDVRAELDEAEALGAFTGRRDDLFERTARHVLRIPETGGAG